MEINLPESKGEGRIIGNSKTTSLEKLGAKGEKKQSDS